MGDIGHLAAPSDAALGVLENRDYEQTALGCDSESLGCVAHDARNLVTALDLYCDLLREPGVLAESFAHYGAELKHLASASRLLVERLIAPHGIGLNAQETMRPMECKVTGIRQNVDSLRGISYTPIHNLAAEVLANRNLLAALAGPTVAVIVEVKGAAFPVRLASEDLTRILVNLVKNASEAMSSVGRIRISLWESAGDSSELPWLTLNVEDNGPGFTGSALEKIYEGAEVPQESIRATGGDWPVLHRGLGLAITRSIVEAAGGRINVANRDPVGACIQIELPVRSVRDSCLPVGATDTNAVLN